MWSSADCSSIALCSLIVLPDSEQMLHAALANDDRKARHLLEQLRMRVSSSLVYSTKTIHKERQRTASRHSLGRERDYWEKVVRFACNRQARHKSRRILLAWHCISSEMSSNDSSPRDDIAGMQYPQTVFSSRSPQNQKTASFDAFPDPDYSTSTAQTPLLGHPVHSLNAEVFSAYSSVDPQETIRVTNWRQEELLWIEKGEEPSSEGGRTIQNTPVVVPKLKLDEIVSHGEIVRHDEKIRRQNEEAAAVITKQLMQKQMAVLAMSSSVRGTDQIPQSPLPKSPSPIPEESWDNESLERSNLTYTSVACIHASVQLTLAVVQLQVRCLLGNH